MTIREEDDAIVFSVRVIPRSSRTEIVGGHDEVLKVKLSAPPVDGAANAELIKLLAKRFGVPKTAVVIVGGETSKTKLLRITGLSAAQFRASIG